MNPEPIRPANLLVHEAMRRLPGADARVPAQRHAAHAQPVVNQCPLAHDDGRRRDDVKMQPRRREGVEVGGVGEEREQLLRRQRQPKFGLEFVNSHWFRSADLASPRSIPANTSWCSGHTPYQ